MRLPIWGAKAGAIGCITLLAVLIPFSYNRLQQDWYRNFVITPTVVGNPASRAQSWKEIERRAVLSYEYNTLNKRPLFDIGRAQLEIGDYDSSIESFKSFLVAYPYSLNAHHNLGTAYTLSGDLEQAMVSFNTVFSLWPTFHLSHFYAGQIREFQGYSYAAFYHYTAALYDITERWYPRNADIRAKAVRRLSSLPPLLDMPILGFELRSKL